VTRCVVIHVAHIQLFITYLSFLLQFTFHGTGTFISRVNYQSYRCTVLSNVNLSGALCRKITAGSYSVDIILRDFC